MAKLHRIVHSGFPPLRGKHGDFIYKWYGDVCVVQRLPRRKKPRRKTAKLKASHDNLRQGVRYAQSVIADPAAKAYYSFAARKLNRSVYLVAKSDAMRRPTIKCSLDYYKGRAGQPVHIDTRDLFRVQTLRITVRDAAGDLVETGEAQREPKKRFFVYHWKRDHPPDELLTFEFVAESRAGHRVVQTRKAIRPA